MTNNTLFRKLIYLVLIILLSACSTSQLVDSTPDVENVDASVSFVEGELVEINPNNLQIRQSDGNVVNLKLSEISIYWDNIEWMLKTPAVTGDKIQAYGDWNKDQSVFEVQRYYANRVDVAGIVYYVCGETEAFMVDQPDQEYVIIPLPQKTELRTETPTDPKSYKYFDLMPNFGEELQVIGREFEEPYLIAVVMTRMD